MISEKPTRIEISYKTVIFTVAFLIALWLIFLIREIIVIIFLAIILVSALLKPVEWLHSKKIPRALAVLIVYALVLVAISFAVGIIVPPLVSQTSEFVTNLPKIVATINEFLVFNKIPVEDVSKVISGELDQLAGNLFSISRVIISSIFLVVTLFVLSIYMLLEWKTIVRGIASPFSGKREKQIISLVSKIENGLGAWVRGQLTLSLIIGFATYIGLTILGVPFALPLALVAGILEVIPLIGPIVSAVPAVLVGLTISPLYGLIVIALFFLIQQIEGHLIVPMIMSKVVGLQPVVVIIALLIGAKLGGMGGAFLAIPVVFVAKIIIKELLTDENKFEEKNF